MIFCRSLAIDGVVGVALTDMISLWFFVDEGAFELCGNCCSIYYRCSNGAIYGKRPTSLFETRGCGERFGFKIRLSDIEANGDGRVIIATMLR